MSEKIGRVVLEGDDAQNAILRPMAQTINAVVGAKLRRDIHVTILPNAQMELVPGTKLHAAGYTPSGGSIQLNRRIMDEPKHARDVLGHEAFHATCAQLARNGFKAALLALLPPGAKWDEPGYSKDGREALACYGSTLFGVRYPPPYTEYYDYVVPQDKIPALKTALLADYPDPVIEEPPPPPAPPDPALLLQQIADLQQQVGGLEIQVQSITEARDELQAQVTSLSGVNTSLQAALDVALGKIEAAKADLG